MIITCRKIGYHLAATKNSIIFFKPYSPKGTEYLNKYDSLDYLDYNTSTCDVQNVCQMLKHITNWFENYNKYFVLS